MILSVARTLLYRLFGERSQDFIGILYSATSKNSLKPEVSTVQQCSTQLKQTLSLSLSLKVSHYEVVSVFFFFDKDSTELQNSYWPSPCQVNAPSSCFS